LVRGAPAQGLRVTGGWEATRMGQLRTALEQMRKQLSTLTLTQKMLITSLVVTVAMAMFVVSQYAGSAQMVELSRGMTSDQQATAVEFLRVNGVDHKMRNGSVYVPLERKYAVLGQMQMQGALPNDTSLLFDTLIDQQSWTMSSAKQRQMYMIAKQNELANIINGMDGIRDAKVMIDSPPRTGIGQSVRLATASASVRSTSGAGLNQHTVDAIAQLIAGSEAGLDVERIRVIDASTNKQYKARSDTDMVASSYLEHQEVVERRAREKVLDYLQYIDGVIVAVSAQVDIRRSTARIDSVLNPGEGTVTAPVQESSHEVTERQASRSGEPGARSNVGLDIAEGRSSGPTHEEVTADSTLTTEFGRKIEQIEDPRGMPTKINASINIPRSYFVLRWENMNGDAAGQGPTDDDLQPVVDAEVERIRGGIQPLVETQSDSGIVTGTVIVSMIPDMPQAAPAQAGGFLAGMATPAAGGGVQINGMAKTVAMGALAFFALALMGLTLRKASKRQELPTPEELVGVPPALQMHSDVVGEADEADAALTGIELSDDDIQRGKLLEQVAALVKDEPREAASIMSRWISEAH
jgi:flagellar M-ring protein FliF